LIQRLKAVIKRHWPALKLRTILLGVLLLVAAMPVFSAERPPARRASAAPDAAAVQAAEDLGPVIDGTVKTTLASILMLDSRGQVVRGYGRGGDLSALPEVKAALGGQPATVLRDNSDYRPDSHYEWLSRASTIRIHHARPIIAEGRVRGVLLMSRSPRAVPGGL
jgi:hypothetical protein